MDELIAFLQAGKYRLKALNMLYEREAIVASDLAELEQIHLSQASRTLLELEETGMVTCTTPKRRKGRLYRITELGRRILTKVGGRRRTRSRKHRTTTSSFGVSKREGHDSSRFYGMRLYERTRPTKVGPIVENLIPSETLDELFCKSSESMDELPDDSVHLMVTSPPYNVGKDYDEDLTLEEYMSLLSSVFAEVYRVLIVGGRACINIANLGRSPYIPLHSFIIQEMLGLGFLMRGELVWDKGASSGSSTAWGSWKSATNPVLRDVHEYILIFSKGAFSRKKQKDKESTISRDEFLTFTKSIWSFPTESAKRVGHPAPFPIELPYRLIQLYTFERDIVLDPFIGSGTTSIACLRTKRHYIGYDTSQEYTMQARKRIADELARLRADKEQTKLDLYA